MATILPALTASQEEPRPEELAREMVEDYLDHLCAPLVGLVPYRDRDRLRQEAGFNIEGRMRTYLLDGLDPVHAAERAIAKYGRSDALGESFLVEWMHYQPTGALARRIGIDLLYAFFFFGQASLWGLVLALVRIYVASPDPVTFGLTLDQVRRLVPEPLPMPDRNPLFVLFWAYLLGAPFVAGALTGSRVLVGSAKAVVQTVLPLVILSFVVGALLWPSPEGLWLASGQLFWWLGVGAGTAHLTSVIVRRRRFRFRLDPPLAR